MANSIRIDRDIPMKTRDGVVLRADVYRPDDKDKHPAILIRSPYNKQLSGKSDYLSAVDAAFARYAFVVQDTRGRFTSEGDYMPGMPEGLDGYDTVEWIASEPWCDGNVGMAGGSYLGRIQWQTAMEAPPSLKAMAPHITTAGPLSETRMSGPLDFEQSVSWFALMAIDMIDKLEKQGKDVSKMREMIDRARFNTDEVINYLPFKDVPHFNFEGVRQGFQPGRVDAILAALKSEKDLYWSYDKVQVPCMHAAGWYDLFVGSLFNNFLSMREKGGSKIAREGQYVLCGPWAHGANLLAFVGGLHFGPVARGVAAFVQERHLAFFDKYLRGIDKDIPLVRYFVMGRDRWQNADTWPLPQTDWQRFYLHSKGRANTASGNGVLSRNEPGSEPSDIFVYDPRFPVPTLGGRNLPTGRLVPGPFDQTLNENRSDVLCYTTPELQEDMEITGPLTLHLFASTSAKDTDFTAKLIDVYPHGAAYNVAEGCIRAKNRKSVLKPEPITPGEVYEFTIDMAHTSIVLHKGHRIRLDVSSSNFPRIDRNMNTGNAFGEDAQGVPAVQTIFHQSEYPSYIDLPVIPGNK
ncbi:MAG: CocE/NonD family hydrolase [Deltaproteobacteria bacterium]|nr:CocE/NonD family hydrolase [Deltaproteobacteria bacterium]